jgi:hypothetical protein
MSYLVATMKKMKAENLHGVFMHDFRLTKNHANEQIDVSKSADNFDLIDHGELSKSAIMDYIKSKRNSKRAVRKDAVVLDEWIISSDQSFFADKTPDQIRGYFQTAVDWFGKKYGRSNLQYAVVHMDETTPHMHLGIVPINEDGSLSSKKMFDRASLQSVQADLPKYLQEHGYDIQRGVQGKNKAHLTTKEYKAVREEEKAIKHDLATAYVDAAIAYHDKEPRGGRDALLQQLEQKSIIEIGNWIKALFKRIRKAIRDLQKREKKLADDRKKLDQREATIKKKEQAFDQFLADYQEPPAWQQANIYLLNVQNNVVKPARELYEAVKGVDDEKQDGASKAPELTIKQDLGKGRSR